MKHLSENYKVYNLYILSGIVLGLVFTLLGIKLKWFKAKVNIENEKSTNNKKYQKRNSIEIGIDGNYRILNNDILTNNLFNEGNFCVKSKSLIELNKTEETTSTQNEKNKKSNSNGDSWIKKFSLNNGKKDTSEKVEEKQLILENPPIRPKRTRLLSNRKKFSYENEIYADEFGQVHIVSKNTNTNFESTLKDENLFENNVEEYFKEIYEDIENKFQVYKNCLCKKDGEKKYKNMENEQNESFMKDLGQVNNFENIEIRIGNFEKKETEAKHNKEESKILEEKSKIAINILIENETKIYKKELENFKMEIFEGKNEVPQFKTDIKNQNTMGTVENNKFLNETNKNKNEVQSLITSNINENKNAVQSLKGIKDQIQNESKEIKVNEGENKEKLEIEKIEDLKIILNTNTNEKSEVGTIRITDSNNKYCNNDDTNEPIDAKTNTSNKEINTNEDKKLIKIEEKTNGLDNILFNDIITNEKLIKNEDKIEDAHMENTQTNKEENSQISKGEILNTYFEDLKLNQEKFLKNINKDIQSNKEETTKEDVIRNINNETSNGLLEFLRLNSDHKHPNEVNKNVQLKEINDKIINSKTNLDNKDNITNNSKLIQINTELKDSKLNYKDNKNIDKIDGEDKTTQFDLNKANKGTKTVDKIDDKDKTTQLDLKEAEQINTENVVINTNSEISKTTDNEKDLNNEIDYAPLEIQKTIDEDLNKLTRRNDVQNLINVSRDDNTNLNDTSLENSKINGNENYINGIDNSPLETPKEFFCNYESHDHHVHFSNINQIFDENYVSPTDPTTNERKRRPSPSILKRHCIPPPVQRVNSHCTFYINFNEPQIETKESKTSKVNFDETIKIEIDPPVEDQVIDSVEVNEDNLTVKEIVHKDSLTLAKEKNNLGWINQENTEDFEVNCTNVEN